MPKELKREVLSEEKKSSILALLAEGYSERHVAFLLKISKTAVHYNKVKQETLGTTKPQTGRGRKRLSTDRDDRQLIQMSLSNRRMTSSDLQKEWQMAAGVKCTARTIRHRLLEAGLKSCKARKKPVPHDGTLPVPVPPLSGLDENEVEYEDYGVEATGEDMKTSGQDEYVPDRSAEQPERFTQHELNDLIRDLSLSKDKAELLASRLKQNNLLHDDVKLITETEVTL
ncbi:uncharacterized protein [Dendrobates tinctorius]|uniref:uncharacterized protein n=1 Tax=Dendrobates tinctorius TaxID=92724 RepID=UPI003CC9E74D